MSFKMTCPWCNVPFRYQGQYKIGDLIECVGDGCKKVWEFVPGDRYNYLKYEDHKGTYISPLYTSQDMLDESDAIAERLMLQGGVHHQGMTVKEKKWVEFLGKHKESIMAGRFHEVGGRPKIPRLKKRKIKKVK